MQRSIDGYQTARYDPNGVRPAHNCLVVWDGHGERRRGGRRHERCRRWRPIGPDHEHALLRHVDVRQVLYDRVSADDGDFLVVAGNAVEIRLDGDRPSCAELHVAGRVVGGVVVFVVQVRA